MNSDYKMGVTIQEWINNANIKTTDLYDELDPKVFYEKLQKVNEGKLAQAPAPEESAEPSAGETPAESPAA